MSETNLISKYNKSENELLEIRKYIETGVKNSQSSNDINLIVKALKKNVSFWKRLFSRKKYSTSIIIYNTDNFPKSYKTKIQLFEFYSEVRLELVRLNCEHFIQSTLLENEHQLALQELEIKKDLAIFCTSHIEQMSQTLNQSRFEFMDKLVKQYDFIEKYKEHTEIVESYNQTLLNETKYFFSTIDTLLKVFTVSLENKLDAEPILQLDENLIKQLIESINSANDNINLINDKILKMTQKLNSSNFN